MNIFSGGKIGPFTPAAKAEASYKKLASSGSTAASDTRPKTDTLELSGHQPPAQKQLPSVSSSILYEVSKSTDQKKLDDLRTRVQDGSYRIPSEALAQSILGMDA